MAIPQELIVKCYDLLHLGCVFLGFLTALIIVLIFSIGWCKNG